MSTSSINLPSTRGSKELSSHSLCPHRQGSSRASFSSCWVTCSFPRPAWHSSCRHRHDETFCVSFFASCPRLSSVSCCPAMLAQWDLLLSHQGEYGGRGTRACGRTACVCRLQSPDGIQNNGDPIRFGVRQRACGGRSRTYLLGSLLLPIFFSFVWFGLCFIAH